MKVKELSFELCAEICKTKKLPEDFATYRLFVLGYHCHKAFNSRDNESNISAYLQKDIAILAIDDSISEKTFGITENKPFLIITDNLLSSEFIVETTARDVIVRQFADMSNYLKSKDNEEIDLETEFFQHLKCNSNVFRRTTVDNKSIASNIADYLAIQTVKNRCADGASKLNSSEWIKNKLAKLRTDIKRAKTEHKVQDALLIYSNFKALVSEARDEAKSNGQRSSLHHLMLHYTPINNTNVYFDDDLTYCLNSSAYISGDSSLNAYQHEFKQNNAPSQKLGNCEKYYIDPLLLNGLERISYAFIVNYNRILKSVFDTNEQDSELYYLDFLTEEDYQLDYSSICTYLAKIIEEEANASVVQLLRYLLFHIKMPHFYRLKDIGKGRCYVCTRDKRIFLNDRGKQVDKDNYEVKAIPIGDLNCVINEVCHDVKINTVLCEFSSEQYLNLMNTVARNRNYGSHNNIATRTDFEDMYQLFTTWVKQYLSAMVNLKNELRSMESEGESCCEG